MNKILPKVFLLIFVFFSFGFALEVRATETIFVYSEVGFDSDAHEASGATATWITYGLYDYYDPAVYGNLFYTNPPDFIDQDGGEGVNSYLYGYYPGYFADFTTNDYRPNKILCTYGEHGLRAIYVPIPFQGYDPYQIGSMNVMSYGAEGQMNIPNSPSNYYSSGDYYVVAETLVCIQTPTVQSVTFETLNSEITNNPTEDFGNGVVFGGGKRIFSNRQSPNDGINRRTVRVRAKLASSGGSPSYTSGVKVFFRNFDVDDPATNTDIDENGADGNDNRDERFVGYPYPASARGTFSNCTGTSNGCYGITDSNGEVTADFQVTRQPGDNFVIAASTDENYLNGVSINGTGLKDSSNQQLPTTGAKRSELLTVWVKVHLEVDSMGAVGNNLVAGRITSKTSVGTTPVWLNVYPGTGSLEVGRFQGGQMTSGTYRFEVLDNTANQVQVRNNNGTAYIFYNSIFQLFDDDDFNGDDGSFPGDGTLDGDDGEDVTFRGNTMFEETFSHLQPSSDINQNPYAAAYIEPDYTWAENQPGMNDSNVQFEFVTFTPPNFDNERRVVNAQRDSVGMENDEFWIGYLLIGYEPISALAVVNNDPPQGAVGGVSPPINYMTAWINRVTDSRDVTRGSVGSIIYIEVMRDSDLTFGGDLRVRTVPHELGHQFGLLGDSSDPTPLPDWGVMGYPSQLVPPLYFVPPHINIMRWRQASPGEQ